MSYIQSKKTPETFTISTPRYATLEDVQNNLSNVGEQLDKMSLAPGVNYDSIISDIKKDIAYITSQVEQINKPPTPETFDSITSSLYSSQLNSGVFSDKLKHTKPLYFKQTNTPSVGLLALTEISPHEQKIERPSKPILNYDIEPILIEHNIMNKITIFMFSIVGLYILFRAFYVKK